MRKIIAVLAASLALSAAPALALEAAQKPTLQCRMQRIASAYTWQALDDYERVGEPELENALRQALVQARDRERQACSAGSRRIVQ